MMNSLVLLVPLILSAPIQSVLNVEKVAQEGAETWLELVDSERYDESWDEAASLIRNAVTKEDWAQSIRGARAPLGKLVSRTVKSRTYTETLPGAPDGHYVVIQFETTFENKKSAVETVTPMKDSDGQWRVSGYYIK